MRQIEDKRIFVLLTKYPDTGSKIFSGFTQGYYSHVSIGFDDTFSLFYSFTKRGFRTEDPSRICSKVNDVSCLLYERHVSEDMYLKMKAHVEHYIESSTSWKYNLVGLICGMLRFPFYRPENRKFCSQFVAEVLESGKAIKLSKQSSVMLPDDFIKLPELNFSFEGNLGNLKPCLAHI